MKGTVATVKAVKATTSAKKAAAVVNKTPKTVPSKSIKSTPKIEESKSVKASNVTPPAKNKTNVSSQPARNNTSTRVKVSEDATKGTDKTSYAREMGKLGESASGITKNTKRMDSITGKANYRIPDGLDDINKMLIEVKNVKKQGYTIQLKDFHLWSKENGYDFILMTRSNTKISKPLQELIDSGDIIHKYIK